jgi:DNA-binding beta-propeller fold protein YncE
METTSQRYARAWTGIACAAVCLLVSQPAAPGPSAPAPGVIVFPPPPAQARIRYVESIIDNRDYAGSSGWWRRAVDRIAGRKEIHSLRRPYGIEAGDGAVYVCDPDAGIVHVFRDEPRRYVRIPEKGRLGSPIDAAIDGRGMVWVTDSEAATVSCYDAKGRLHRTLAAGVRRPTGIAYQHARDRLYVVDTVAHHVLVFSANGDSLGVMGRPGAGDGEFNFPTAIWIDSPGRIYVTDAMNFRVQVFDADARFLLKFGNLGDGAGDFSKPKGIATDSEGHIYVVDAMFDAVQVFDSDGRLLLAFGSAGKNPAEFWLPTGITIDARDRIYVADSYNHRVQVFQYLREDAGGGR